ncbi:uncharacterized protein MKK02DRAFT_38838 [Dioszegia hungarica]|uniref:LysM domain-containing protein n=1 Tax=Dioszegia hungarica TaxID=4972 RepID=A0AA38H7F7_9TREE|nr:uncharacterized protein MKK02DRAFT_38838 [Dioszegia hungarica]KAI9634166.1 hypothetical protein MKK02DRAFT_38838 [Dioszegia hungarica]
MATATVSGTGSSASTGRNANAAGPSRRSPASPSALRPVERERDIWGLGLSSDLPPTPSPAPSQTHSRQPSLLRRRPLIPTNGDTGAQGQGHPLYRTDSPPRHSEDSYVEVLSDVSRPNLTRLTSDLERRAGSSRGNGSEEGSRKGSLDMLRMSTNEAQGGGEVEVLIHQVQPNESLAGIALLYGIDLATLRKTNKLWPSDPVHLRRHLYVPLEACKWNKASETLIRGPGEGQVTLAPKNPGNRKGREREVTPNLIDLTDDSAEMEKGHRRAVSMAVATQSPSLWKPQMTRSTSEAALSGEDVDPWSSFSPIASAHSTGGWGDTLDERPPSPPSLPHMEPAAGPPHTRTVDIVRIPSSQLRFFPKPPKPPDSSRTSFDSGPRPPSSLRPIVPSSSPPLPPLSIQNDLNFSHETAPSRKSSLTASSGGSMVRLRPPTSAPSSGTGLADKLSNFFFIPPPPAGGLSVPPPRSRPNPARISLDSARSSPRGSVRGSTAGSPTIEAARPAEEVEMMLRDRRGSAETLRVNGGKGKGNGNGVSGDRRKLD